MTADIFKDESKRKRFLSMIPMGRAGNPEDLAGISVFLASGASDYITGQSFYVDGGWLAGGGNISG
jgi:2-deoxy-D-gluconate 3-dehydrogenase